MVKYLDAEKQVTLYRQAVEQGDQPKAQQLRDEWRAYNGDDELHELAFGEPLSDET